MAGVTPLLTLAIVLYSVNAVFFAFLSYTYGRTALSTKAKYPLGLLVFSILLLVQCAGTAYTYFAFSYYLGDASPLMSLMAAMELVGVGILARITL
jgi:hypothetical protein